MNNYHLTLFFWIFMCMGFGGMQDQQAETVRPHQITVPTPALVVMLTGKSSALQQTNNVLLHDFTGHGTQFPASWA
jgi:hypothetical protein